MSMKYKMRLVNCRKTVIDFGSFDSDESLESTFNSFLNDPATMAKYKVEPYSTIHFEKRGRKRIKVVDFGDYSNFIEIEYVS